MGLGVGACAGPPPSDEPERSRPADFSRPLEVYRQVGLMTGPAAFPVVGSVATLAGAADSTLLLVGLSLPATALSFQRDGAGFAADYVVAIRLTRDDRTVRVVDRRETVRVGSFAETARTDEAVVFQIAIPLEPGRYVMMLRARDGLTARGIEASDTVDVPAYSAAGLPFSAPLLVHDAAGRAGVAADPELILNPRHTVPYGGPRPKAYVELYDSAAGGPDARALRLVLEDEDGLLLWSDVVAPGPAAGLGTAVVEVPTENLPLGRFRLSADDGATRVGPVPLVIGLSDGWLISNFEEVLEFLRYIAGPEELQALRRAPPEERQERWEAFWTERDPYPASPGNEFRDMFFERIRVAAEQFAEPGRPGWRTDRGEAYIVLGPPSRYTERQVGREGPAGGRPDAQEWVYEGAGGGRLTLLFVDRTGFGRYEMTAASRSAFRAAARRMRPRE